MFIECLVYWYDEKSLALFGVLNIDIWLENWKQDSCSYITIVTLIIEIEFEFSDYVVIQKI